MDEDVARILVDYQTEKYFNPSARSSFSLEVANEIAAARLKVAKLVGAESYNVFFTSGGTESDNIGIVGSLKSKKGNIVVSSAEHSAVYATVLALQNRGYEVRVADVLSDGHIDSRDFLSKVDSQTLLACFMHVNNETGAVNDVKAFVKAVKSKNKNTICFSDGVQAVGKIPVNLADLCVDIYTLSAHKFHAGKGVGALFVKKGLNLNPLMLGGGQESGLRSGTENVGGIIALAQALETAVKNIPQNTQNFLQYKSIIRDCLAPVADWRENCVENCSPAIMSLAFAGVKGEVLLHMLEKFGLVVGTGSACSSKNKQNRIAKALKLPQNYVEGILRISFSKYNALDEAKLLGEKLCENVFALRQTMIGKV